LEPAILDGPAFYIWHAAGLQAYRLTGLLPTAALMTLSSTMSQYRELTQQVTDVTLMNLPLSSKERLPSTDGI
jgi:hypothetical protein